MSESFPKAESNNFFAPSLLDKCNLMFGVLTYTISIITGKHMYKLVSWKPTFTIKYVKFSGVKADLQT